MRGTRAAHAGNRSEPLLQLAVERDDFRILCPACRAFIWNSSTSSRLNPNWIDCRFDNVRTNSPAATSIRREIPIWTRDQRLAQADAPKPMREPG